VYGHRVSSGEEGCVGDFIAYLFSAVHWVPWFPSIGGERGN
jgi:hypothetical protein